MENEAISHQINNSAAMAELYAKNEALGDSTRRREYFASMDADGFVDLLQQVNSVIRTGNAQVMQPFDGKNVFLALHTVPDQQDKEQLLKETWDTAHKFLTDPTLDDEDALTFAGLTVAGGTLLVHPFIDSNGRTSRVVSHMIINGQNEGTPSELSQLLGAEGGDAWSVTPTTNVTRIYAEYKYEKSDMLPARIDWGNDLLEEDAFSGNVSDPVNKLANTGLGDRVLHKFVLNTDDRARELIGQYIEYDEGGNPISLDAKKALQAIVNDPEQGIKYAAQLNELEQWSRADYLRRYLVSMQDESRLASKMLQLRARNFQETGNLGAANEAELRAFGRLAVDGEVSARDHARILFARSGINLKRGQNTK